MKSTHNNIECHVEKEIDDEYGQYERSEIGWANHQTVNANEPVNKLASGQQYHPILVRRSPICRSRPKSVTASQVDPLEDGGICCPRISKFHCNNNLLKWNLPSFQSPM